MGLGLRLVLFFPCTIISLVKETNLHIYLMCEAWSGQDYESSEIHS